MLKELMEEQTSSRPGIRKGTPDPWGWPMASLLVVDFINMALFLHTVCFSFLKCEF